MKAITNITYPAFALFAFACFGLSPQLLAADRFITFDAPGAVNGTIPSGINPAGTVTGLFFSADFVPHGFVRNPGRMIIAFDPPGATSQTIPTGINPVGTVVGSYCDNVACHGFLRAPDGTITTFDAPGAGTGFFQGTFCSGIND